MRVRVGGVNDEGGLCELSCRAGQRHNPNIEPAMVRESVQLCMRELVFCMYDSLEATTGQTARVAIVASAAELARTPVRLLGGLEFTALLIPVPWFGVHTGSCRLHRPPC